jgi:hypothetical protein
MLVATVIFGHCGTFSKSGSKESVLISDNDFDYRNRYEYQYDHEKLPKLGDPEELIYKNLGRPSGRFTFKRELEHQIGGKKFMFDKFFLYQGAKVEYFKTEEYSGTETLESMTLTLFVHEGKISHIGISHLIKEGERKNNLHVRDWSQGPLDTYGKEFVISESFPGARQFFKIYWEENKSRPEARKN